MTAPSLGRKLLQPAPTDIITAVLVRSVNNLGSVGFNSLYSLRLSAMRNRPIEL